MSLNVNGNLEIVDEYGNIFDIKDSILNTATLENCAFISFYNPDLEYILEYFFENDRIWLEGKFDENYWTDEKMDMITERMKKTNYDNLNNDNCPYCKQFAPADIDLEKAVDIMFEEMKKYSIYMNGRKIPEVDGIWTPTMSKEN